MRLLTVSGAVYTCGMWPDAEPWDPWTWMRDRYPAAQVRDMNPGVVQGCVDPERQIIWIARGLTDVERRCVLAYELGQLDQWPTPDDPFAAAARERAAQEWAALMLIPTDRLFEAFAVSNDYAAMAAYLRVDLQTLRVRFRSMTDAEQDGVMQAIRDMQAAT